MREDIDDLSAIHELLIQDIEWFLVSGEHPFTEEHVKLILSALRFQKLLHVNLVSNLG